jgi:vitamin B12 transporter
MNRSRCLTVLAVLTLAAEDTLATYMEQILVTATRTVQTEDETLASVSVITRHDIERLQPQSLQDLLRGVPGLTLSNSGGAGKKTSLFLRGAESDHVLVLLDGIKLGSATSGAMAIQDLPIKLIDRIEIVRGPRSSLYGSEAIGGVVQIFTRQSGGDVNSRFSVDLGSHSTQGGSLGLSDSGERGWYSVDLAYSDSDGFDACRGKPGVGGCGIDESDADGYRSESAALRAGYRFDNGIEIDFYSLQADGENEYDGLSMNESEIRQQVVGGSLRFIPADSWLLSLTGGQSRDNSDNFKDGVFFSAFDTERDSVTLQGDVDLGIDRLLTLGIDYQKEQVDSSVEYAVENRDNRGYFIQYQGMISAHDLQFSLRRDDHETFDKYTTGGVAWGYALSSGLRLWASYATAFKAPSFNELYYPDFGDPDLQPEESLSLEFGLQGRGDWGTWSFSGYQTRIDELIVYNAAIQSAVNISQARILGVEAQVSVDIGSWQSSASLTLLDPRDDSGGVKDGNLLPRRTRQSLRIDLDRTFGAHALGATLHVEGQRYDDLDNRRKLGGFGTLDLRASYRINQAWQLRGRCENLFDKVYETAAFYNQAGRSFYLTLSYQS